MSALTALEQARSQITEAQKVLSNKAKDAVREGLDEVFADPSVKVVIFAQKSSEYNDEGMYPGVFGPEVRTEDVNVDQLIDDRWDEFYDLLYGYGNSAADPRAPKLKAALEAVGQEVLSDLFGNECLVFVTKGDKGYDFQSEYAGC